MAGMAREEIYRGRILNLVKLDGRWEVIEHAAAVAVLAYRHRGERLEVLGVRQKRVAVGCETWELPAGLIEPGETPEAAAARELAEETGYSGVLELITQVYSSPGFTDEKVYLFAASELRPAQATPDADEVLRVSWEDPQQLWRQIRQGQLATSAPTALGLLQLAYRLKLPLE